MGSHFKDSNREEFEMKSLLFFVLVVHVLYGAANDVTCKKKGKFSKTITIGSGDSYSFNTQAKKKYGGNVKCGVTYKRGSSCPKIRFSCSEFDINNKNSKCSGKTGDRMMIQEQGSKKSKSYCKKKSPDVSTTSKFLKVSFISNKKKHSTGAECRIECESDTTTPTSTGGSGPTVAPPSGTTIPNPGGAAQELTLSLVQSWSQETDYTRTAKVAVPATTAGQKVPVVFHLHGNGGQGNTRPVGGWLGDECIIVAPDGYERSWNVYTEKSKADDVSFILDLITKIGTDIPAADMNNVNIIGTSNGAALTYRLMIETGADRPFKRAFPMVSSLISPQYHDNQFWASPVSAAPGEANVYDTAVVPVFAQDFEYAHFHGTEDGALQYEGQSPGPGFLGGADVIAAQKTDYLWAVAMGYSGPQLADSAGVSIGTDAQPVQEYSYLGGKVRHYKLVGEGHGTGPGHTKVQEIVRAAVLGL